MINVTKQIEYWQTGANEELLNAKVMLDNERYLPCLFFCHLCIEKILKALVVKETAGHPPKIHDLEKLAILAKIDLDYEQNKFILALMIYQLEGRYPQSYPQAPDQQITKKYYEETINLLGWFRQTL